MNDTYEEVVETESGERTIGDISHRTAVQATKAFFADLREHEDTAHLANALENMEQADRMAMMVRLGILVDGFITRAIAETMDEVALALAGKAETPAAETAVESKEDESSEQDDTGLQNLTQTF